MKTTSIAEEPWLTQCSKLRLMHKRQHRHAWNQDDKSHYGHVCIATATNGILRWTASGLLPLLLRKRTSILSHNWFWPHDSPSVCHGGKERSEVEHEFMCINTELLTADLDDSRWADLQPQTGAPVSPSLFTRMHATPVYRFFVPCRGSPELSIWHPCSPGKGFHHQTLQIQLPRLDAHQTQQITNGNNKLPQIVQDSFSELWNLPCDIVRTNICSLWGFWHLFASPAALSENMKPLFSFLIFLEHSLFWALI